jgi:hypothetical protein
VAVYVVFRILLGLRQVFYQMVLPRPTPVVGPKMDVAIVNVLIAADALIAVPVVLTAP